jgi:hypothetical protein
VVSRIAECVQDHASNGNGQHVEPARDLPAAIGAGAILDADAPLKPVVVDGWFRRQEVGVVVGGSKSRKSFFLMILMLSIATGRMFLGMFPVRRGRVLLIDNELDLSVLKSRLVAVAAAMGVLREEYEAWIDIVPLRGVHADMIDIGNIIRRAGEGVYAVAFIDAMYRTYPEGFDENSNADMTALLTGLVGVGRDVDCAICLVHHLSKGAQGQKSVTDLGAGAGSLSRLVDFHIGMRQHEEPDCCVVDGVVRSFKQFERVGIAWGYPLWTHDGDLDVNRLAGMGGRPKAPKEPKPPAPEPIGVAEFVGKFVTDQPVKQDVIKAKARAAGVKVSEVATLLILAEAEQLIHGWEVPGSNAIHYANREQLLTDTPKVSKSKTQRGKR